MKRVIIYALILFSLSSAPLFAQGFSTHVNGYGGIGFDHTGITSDGSSATANALLTDFGITANGYLYHPLLLDYNFNGNYDRTNDTVDQGNTLSRALNLNTGFSFLPDSKYPSYFYFTRQTTNVDGSLTSPFSILNTNYGVRGEIRGTALGHLGYNLGSTSSSNQTVFSSEDFVSRSKFAGVSLDRKLGGWDLRAFDNYTHQTTNFTGFSQGYNLVNVDAGRAFDNGIHLGLDGSYSTVGFHDASANTGNSSSSSLLLSSNMTWRHTEKLSSQYTFNFNRDAVNTAQLLAIETGVSNPLPPGPTSTESTSESMSSGVSYRATTDLTLAGSLGFSHNSIPEQSVQQLLKQGSLVTDSTFDLQGGYAYHHKIWKVDFTNASTLNWQRFSLLRGKSDAGMGYSVDTRLRTGKPEIVQFGVYHVYTDHNNPVFFQLVSLRENRFGGSADSNYFRFMKLQAAGEVTRGNTGYIGSRINLDTDSVSAAASFPKRRLTLYASHMNSNSNNLLFGSQSIIFQSGGSTGGLGLPGNLLLPQVVNQTRLDHYGATWHPKYNLDLEARYTRTNAILNFAPTTTVNRYSSFDVLANYKFGRFTITGAYGKILSGTDATNIQTNRFYIRIHFPFHIIG